MPHEKLWACVRQASLVVALLSLVQVGCRRRIAPHVQADVPTKSPDAAVAPPVCVAPGKLTLVKTLPGSVVRWERGELLVQDGAGVAALDPNTLRSRPLSVAEAQRPPSVDLSPFAAVPLPKGSQLTGVDAGRWLTAYEPSRDLVHVVDARSGREVPGLFVSGRPRHLVGGRAIQRSPDSVGLLVVDLASQRELYRCPSCTLARCGFEGPKAAHPTAGRALHCETEDEDVESLVALDDASHPVDHVRWTYDRSAPDDAYVVTAPTSAARPDFEYRRTFGQASRPLPVLGAALPFRTSDVSFCGNGELFAIYASRRGHPPTDVSIFRGSDGALLATAAGPVAHPKVDERTLLAEFDPSGRFFVMTVQTTPLGGPDPAVTTDQVFDATYLYRLDP